MTNTDYDVVQQKLLRYSILYEFKLGSRPREICKTIQKIFGSNSETSLRTIERWFKKFSLGDENLEFNLCGSEKAPDNQLKSSAASNSISPNDTQTKLLLELKDQVDLLYRKINTQNCCLQLVDRFVKRRLNKPKKQSSTISQDDQQKSLEIFCKKYRFLRRRCRKINNSSFYEILYDSLYSCDKKMEETKNDTNKKVETPEYKKEEEESSCFPVHLENSMISLPNSSIAMRIKSKATKLVRPKARLRRSTKSTRPDNQTLDEQQPIACGQCGKVLKTKERLKIHVKHNHELADRFRCTFEGCTANYAFCSELNRHIRIVHTKDATEFRCSYCPYMTYYSHMLQKHLNIHTGERPYKCIWPGCDQGFKSTSTLAIHRRSHENHRQFRCHWSGCQSDFNYRNGLKRHIKNIHEPKQNDNNNLEKKNEDQEEGQNQNFKIRQSKRAKTVKS